MNRLTFVSLALVAVNLMACCCGVQLPNKGVVAKPGEKPKEAVKDFLSPSESATIGEVRIDVLSGSVGKISSTTGRLTYDTKNEYFQVRLRITNLSDTKLLNYDPWCGSGIQFAGIPTVTDEHGNTYGAYREPFSARAAGFLGHLTRVDPGKSVDDTFAFERPVERATEFTIRLPGQAVGAPSANVTYRFPRAFFEKK